jgi:hypothetical protein
VTPSKPSPKPADVRTNLSQPPAARGAALSCENWGLAAGWVDVVPLVVLRVRETT